MTHSTKAAVIGLLIVLIVAAVAFGVWYLFQPQTLIDTATISIDTIPHGGLKIIGKTACVKRRIFSVFATGANGS